MTGLDDPVLGSLADPGRDEGVALRSLRARLATDAAAAGLLDLSYRVADSPVGALLVVAGRNGVVRVAFEQEDHDRVLADLSERISPRLLWDPVGTDAIVRELDRYFAGRADRPSVPVDLRLASPFRRDVLRWLLTIPAGTTRSYADVAAGVGRPGAVRAVGSACATNPVPILVPCHRVVRSDGSLGGYLGGLPAKSWLLELESTRPGGLPGDRMG
jgi:methylated-DNA-[protein]-cysteine S-methyltransferase